MPKNCPIALRHRVTIQTRSLTSDGQGGSAETWADGSHVWCAIEPIKGYERYQAMQMQTPVTHKLTMRYNSSVTTSCRLKFGDRIFSVVEVLNQEERDRWLIVKAMERQ